MGYRHDRDDILGAAVELALDGGLGSLSFGRVASHLGISDRMVVYYFPSKADLISSVAVELGTQLQGLLERAFGPEPLDVDELQRRAWPVLASSSADGVFRVFFEMIGLAAAGSAPYDTLAPTLLQGWIDWLATRISGGSDAERRRQAAGVVARMDGLLMVRTVLGPRTANAAASELGLR